LLAARKALVNRDVFLRLKPEEGGGRKRLFHCGAGQVDVTISPYGEMNFCPQIHYPRLDILGASFNHCWEELKKLIEDIKIPEKYQCDNCVLAAFCHWCPAQAWLLKRDFFTCDEESRKMALIEAGFNCGVP
jgi:radical SAM protein with 4Fe4S-binding SPASM domain